MQDGEQEGLAGLAARKGQKKAASQHQLQMKILSSTKRVNWDG